LYSIFFFENQKCPIDESGTRTHASEETGALNQRLRPLGHLAHQWETL
uniref:Uncharacterized protein n=1 Tax=Elaeophora elaphi TaxID=1147741 RepID=A0A0R3RQN4_9BILA